jgi:opacity protein-like surface antigen
VLPRKILCYSKISLCLYAFCSGISTYGVFPTSEKALKKEEKFLLKIAKKIHAEDEEGSKKIKSQQEQNEKKEVVKNKSKELVNVSNEQELTTTEQVNLKRVVKEAPKIHNSDTEFNTKQNKATKTIDESKQVFSGFYGGIDGNIVHNYPKAELWSKTYSSTVPDGTNNAAYIQRIDAMNSMFYGSYAYNNNTWTASGKIFAGYDISILKRFRIGIELQGIKGWRETEITSSGVYCARSRDAVANGMTKQFTFNGQLTDEVDFAYVRQTIKTPYAMSLYPKFGVTLSKGVLFYTKIGIKYENIKITDCTETIDVLVQKLPKKESDVIFCQNKPAFVAGIGLEATISTQTFLRMECLCSGTSGFVLDSNDLNTMTTDRTLEAIKIESSRNFSFGFGAGIRF